MSEQKVEKDKGHSLLGWLMWWKIDEGELKKQVDEYENLKITQSSRGQSLLAVAFSSVLTILLVIFLDFDSSSFFDAFLLLALGFFMFKGHRWAMIASMIIWTFEKGYSLFTGTNPFMAILWWSIYMHIFLDAFRVETIRAKARKAVGLYNKKDHFDELEKLADLKTRGIITEEDFNTKKKQILGL